MINQYTEPDGNLVRFLKAASRNGAESARKGAVASFIMSPSAILVGGAVRYTTCGFFGPCKKTQKAPGCANL